jgi:curved DNA-binding protein CbpA
LRTIASEFTDYYEVLEISPNANSGTIERVFRHLAQIYHPDNRETGNRSRFDVVLEAHDTLKDPAKRAQYDIAHQSRSNARAKLVEELADSRGLDRGTDTQNKLLSVLYVKCRQNVREPGIGEVELERLGQSGTDAGRVPAPSEPAKTVIIFQDEPDNWQYHALTQELRNYGSPSKKIVCVSAVLYVFDFTQGAMVEIPVSRWKLVQIGLSCIMAALMVGR